ncbi:MAG: hypothetical protein WCO63_01415 [Bacteroidota bacterium]
MKSCFLILLCLTISFPAYCGGRIANDNPNIDSASLSVSLVYFNNQLSPITFTKVLLKKNGIIVDSSDTGITGQVIFTNLPSGTYQCIPKCTKPWGGANATDAQAVERNFVHISNFYLIGIKLWAAEINGIGATPGALDALLIVRRFADIIPNFMPPGVLPGQPDWKYETINIVISENGTFYQQIKMLCTGDVNGSYIPY